MYTIFAAPSPGSLGILCFTCEIKTIGPGKTKRNNNGGSDSTSKSENKSKSKNNQKVKNNNNNNNNQQDKKVDFRKKKGNKTQRQVREIVNTAEDINVKNEHKEWFREHKRYESEARRMHGKGYMDPFNHIEISPIRTEVSGGVVTVRYDTILTTSNESPLTVVIGSAFNPTGDAIPTACSLFPYDEQSAMVVSWTAVANAATGTTLNLMDSPSHLIPTATKTGLAADLRDFASNIRILGVGLQLIPTGPALTRQGQFLGACFPTGGINAVEPVTDLKLTNAKMQNCPSFVMGDIVSDYAYVSWFPKSEGQMNYNRSDHILNTGTKDSTDIALDWGCLAISAQGSGSGATYIARTIFHYQLDPSRNVFQLLRPVATPCNSKVIDEMFNWFKTHCEVHMLPNTGKYELSPKPTIETGHFTIKRSYKADWKPPTEVSSKYADLFKKPACLGDGMMTLAEPKFNLITFKDIIHGIGKGIKFGSDIASPLLDIVRAAEVLFA